MAAPAPVPPGVFKAVLERLGYVVSIEDDYNWGLFKADAPRPIITIPKEGELLSLTIMMEVLHQLKIDDGTFFDLLQQVRQGQ